MFAVFGNCKFQSGSNSSAPPGVTTGEPATATRNHRENEKLHLPLSGRDKEIFPHTFTFIHISESCPWCSAISHITVPSFLFKFLFQDLVDSESLLATQPARSDKKTEVFSQQLLSGNNVSNKMKPALCSWKIYCNSPNAQGGNVNTNQPQPGSGNPGCSQGTAPRKAWAGFSTLHSDKHPHRGLYLCSSNVSGEKGC